MKKILLYALLLLFSVVEAKSQDCTDGTILFKEDFGGNLVEDLDHSTTAIPECEFVFKVDGDPRGAGNYVIRKEGWHHDPYWTHMDDHTYPNDKTRGYLMQVDASATPGQFYKRQIDGLCAGALLYFSVWAANSINQAYEDQFQKASLSFVIEDINGNVLLKENTGLMPGTTNENDWNQYGATFTVPSGQSSVIFKILNNGNNTQGNDLVLDDIEIRLCVPPTTVSISPKDTVCKGETVTLTGQFTNDGTFTEPLTYKWFKSATASYNQSDWTEIAAGKTLTISSAQSSDAGFYRIAVASVGSIDMENCRSMSDIVSLTVQDCQSSSLVVSEDTTICSGSSVELRASGVVSYSWSPATGLSSTTIANPLASPTSTTTYTVTGTLADNTTLSTSVTVSVLTSTITVLKDTICQNDSYTENGFNLPIQTESGEKIYSLHLLSQNGCDSIVQLNLQVLPESETARQVFIEHGESIQIDNQTYSFPTEVISRYTSVSGCDSVVVTTISWKDDSSECDELIPDKYFSPNNDGVQDTWNIKNIECYDGYVVEIYDRFSKLLIRYEGNFTPWNGIYLGNPQQATDYWYLITLKGGKTFSGHFTLKR